MESPGRSRLLAGPGLWGTLWSKPYGHTHLAFFDLKIMGGGGDGGRGLGPSQILHQGPVARSMVSVNQR